MSVPGRFSSSLSRADWFWTWSHWLSDRPSPITCRVITTHSYDFVTQLPFFFVLNSATLFNPFWSFRVRMLIFLSLFLISISSSVFSRVIIGRFAGYQLDDMAMCELGWPMSEYKWDYYSYEEKLFRHIIPIHQSINPSFQSLRLCLLWSHPSCCSRPSWPVRLLFSQSQHHQNSELIDISMSSFNVYHAWNITHLHFQLVIFLQMLRTSQWVLRFSKIWVWKSLSLLRILLV